MATSQELRKIFHEKLNKFLESCIPLSEKDHLIYFISESSQLYGFDSTKNILFEPTSTSKFNLIQTSMDTYFTLDVTKSLEERTGVKYTDLTELQLKSNYRERYIARKFFFCKTDSRIYIWSMVTGKWEKSDTDSIRHIFANNEILLDPSILKKTSKAKSLTDLGIEFNDLEEISLRFRDASIHYYHKKLNKIYSLNIAVNVWYVPTESVQKQLLVHVKSSGSDSKITTTESENIGTGIDLPEKYDAHLENKEEDGSGIEAL